MAKILSAQEAAEVLQLADNCDWCEWYTTGVWVVVNSSVVVVQKQPPAKENYNSVVEFAHAYNLEN